MLTPLRPGICYGCQGLVWRIARAQRMIEAQNIVAGQVFLLWPEPDSVYARFRTETGSTPGITFCPDCAPRLGDRIEVLAQPATPQGVPIGAPYVVGGPVIGLESAHSRYFAYYADELRTFYETWFRDALSLEGSEITALLALWDSDRHGRLDRTDDPIG